MELKGIVIGDIYSLYLKMPSLRIFRKWNSQRKWKRVVEVTLWLGRLSLRPECAQE